jgi:parallel beta-helix repeat protein
MNFSGPMNIRWFGATPDDATDDTVAIRKAIAALPASGGSVYVPPGTFLVNAEASEALLLRSGVHLSGAGPASIIKFVDEPTPGAYDGHSMLHAVPSSAQGIEIHDLQLDGDRLHYSGGQVQNHAALLEGCHDCRVTRVTIHDFRGDGVYLFKGTGADRSRHCVLSDNVIYDMARASVNLDGASDVVVSSNTFYVSDAAIAEGPSAPSGVAIKMEQDDPGQDVSGIVIAGNVWSSGMAAGIGLSGGGTARIRDVSITGNTFNLRTDSPNPGQCLNLFKVEHVTISGNACNGGMGGGFQIFGGPADYVTISGNTLRGQVGGATTAAISVGGGNYDQVRVLNISGNIIKNVTRGVSISRMIDSDTVAHFVNITGNTFVDCTHGIVLAESQDVTISANTFTSTVASSYAIKFDDANNGSIHTSRVSISNNNLSGTLVGGILQSQFSQIVDFSLTGNDFRSPVGGWLKVNNLGPAVTGTVVIANNAGYP